MSHLVTPPLSLYVHIPWCLRKCPYCDFNSHQADQNGLPEKDYIESLKQDLLNELEHFDQTELGSIFIGGGTPSLFSGKAIAAILNEAEKRFSFSKNIEITLEANPGAIEQKKFTDYRAAGVNRLSIGIQSFNEQRLKNLGRIHNGSEARQAIRAARESGFTNINLDLMHGLPQQSQQEAMHDLQQAVHFEVPHISWYQLTIEPNTEFYKRPPALPPEETLANIQDAGFQLLADSGYHQYEVSAFSQANRQSVHNLNYWLFGDYIGIGAGAHGKRSVANKKTILRTWKTRNPVDYLNEKKSFLVGSRNLSQDELPPEFMMNALRLIDGCPVELFEQRTGLSREVIRDTWQHLQANELMTEDPDRLQTTSAGQRYLNEVLQKFMP